MPARSFFRNSLLAGSLLLIAGTACPARSAQTPSQTKAHKHEYHHEIEQVEDAWRTALLKSDSAGLATLLDDDYTGITAKGAIQTKEQAVNSLRTGALQVVSFQISDRKIRIYSNTAVVTSVAELTGGKNDKEVTGRYRYTRVYVRNQQGQWKIVNFEASRIQ